MRRDALLAGCRYCLVRLPVPPQHHGCQAHDRSVAGCLWTNRSRDRVAGSPETLQSLPGRDADIDAIASWRIFALTPPPHETLHEIALIEAAIRDQAVGETQREARVIGPFPWFQAAGASADHVSERRVCVALSELQSRAKRIAHREPQKAPRARSTVGSSDIALFCNIGDRPAGQDVLFLLASFDRAGPSISDRMNCLIGGPCPAR